ncbi:MAG: hypothetical protein JWO36_3592 [Myxococcales bacterium]|nr:hypothetical protein [Myxococcales bacterium]
MIRLATIAIAACVLIRPAYADDKIEQARAVVEAADTDYKLGRFHEALEKYSKAYELYPAAPLLFNIGQCHRYLKDYEKAIFFFQGYLRDDPTASNHAVVEDLIREAKTELDKQQTSPDPVAETKRAEEAKRQSEQETQRRAEQDAKRRAEDDARRRADEDAKHGNGHTSRLLPISLVAGGAAAFVGGVAFYYYGQPRGPNEMFVYDDTRILGGTMMVLGGAAAITGSLLLARHPSSAPIAAVVPGGLFVGWAGEL